MSVLKLKDPSELKGLSLDDLIRLSEDIRQTIISVSLKNGGHLGASLGAVELAIAWHRVFDSPHDAIIWDVGHQAYAHKLLTGRWERFNTLRKKDGLSGFLSRKESPHDVFGGGHSSTAISAALAISWAKARNEKSKSQWTTAVVGDGGLTAGLAFEALNNVPVTELGKFLLVLNDNQMSISPNRGALPAILSGENVREYFNLFGFDYVGPVDGHDIGALTRAFEEIKSGDGTKPIVLHALTQKGRGYVPAEDNPGAFHGVSPVVEKVSVPTRTQPTRTYSELFGKKLVELAQQDPRVVAVTAAMREGTGLSEFAERFPDRFFDVGIAEQHAVTFAAGLATQGYRPVVAIYSTFFQRALDQVIHDVALQNLGVTFVADRAGIVGADGPTHHGVFDICFFGMIPGLQGFAPTCLEDLPLALEQALASGKPAAIRIPRGSGIERFEKTDESGIRVFGDTANARVFLVALGSSASRTQAAWEKLKKCETEAALIVVNRFKPIPQPLLVLLNSCPRSAVLIVEDGVEAGGFGSHLILAMLENGALNDRAIKTMAFRDEFIEHGSLLELEKEQNISVDDIFNQAKILLSS